MATPPTIAAPIVGRLDAGGSVIVVVCIRDGTPPVASPPDTAPPATVVVTRGRPTPVGALPSMPGASVAGAS